MVNVVDKIEAMVASLLSSPSAPIAQLEAIVFRAALKALAGELKELQENALQNKLPSALAPFTPILSHIYDAFEEVRKETGLAAVPPAASNTEGTVSA